MSAQRAASFKTRWQRAVCLAELSPSAKLGAFVIGAHMDLHGRAWPSRETIRQEAGWNDVSTVTRRLGELKRAGLLTWKSGGGRHKPNVYQAQIPVQLSTRLAEKGVQSDTETGAEVHINEGSHAPGSSYEVHKEERLAALEELKIIEAPNPSDDINAHDALREVVHAS
jgi:hypothetical protein